MHDDPDCMDWIPIFGAIDEEWEEEEAEELARQEELARRRCEAARRAEPVPPPETRSGEKAAPKAD